MTSAFTMPASCMMTSACKMKSSWYKDNSICDDVSMYDEVSMGLPGQHGGGERGIHLTPPGGRLAAWCELPSV